jgi:signal transduction histidine kinase/ActR/RegA family two-component response regulator
LAVALWAGLRERALRLKIAGQAELLRQSEERHRAIFEGAHDGLIVLGPPDAAGDQPVEQMNPAARRLLRVGEPPPGTTLRSLLPAEVALHGLIAAAVTDRKGAVTGEYACANQTGWWRVTVGPLGPRTLVALADITEATETRERLQRQEEQMRHTQKLEAIGTLAGGVAHDFNNLLTAIMGNTELSLMTLPPARHEAENLRQVMSAARRARQIVKQILTFSRHSEPMRELLSVSPILEETVSFLRTVARGAVEFEHVRSERLPNIVADAAQLHQVLMNVGTNAVQAMRGAPGVLTILEEEVMVGAEVQAQHPKLTPGRYVRIGIRDTGAGMTAPVRERIFEPFFTTKALGEGTGLGLSVVHGIMEKHGGAVTVYSQPGRGSLFHLYFPAAAGDAAAVLADDWSRVPRGNGERVLFVDDDAVIAATAEQILTRLGYRVTVHTRAADALAEFFAPGAEFAVVVSDLSMPECNGLELAARFRAAKPLVPFVLASGFFSAAEETEAEALRITLRLHKPLTYAGLGRAVAKTLGRGSRAPFVVG